MSKKYLSCADTAKLIRQSLKEAFAGVKFSVKSHVYSGGASINLQWTDGPSCDQVKSIVGRFEGASFDGMIDLKSYNSSIMNGEPVSFGADYVFYRREYTQAVVEAAIDAVCAKYGEPDDGRPTFSDYQNGRVSYQPVCGFRAMRDLLGIALQESSLCETKASATAESVRYAEELAA